MRGQEEGGISYHIITEKGFHLGSGSVLGWHMVADSCSPVLIVAEVRCHDLSAWQSGRKKKKSRGTQNCAIYQYSNANCFQILCFTLTI